jgi:hypothetical protein
MKPNMHGKTEGKKKHKQLKRRDEKKGMVPPVSVVKEFDKRPTQKERTTTRFKKRRAVPCEDFVSFLVCAAFPPFL